MLHQPSFGSESTVRTAGSASHISHLFLVWCSQAPIAMPPTIPSVARKPALIGKWSAGFSAPGAARSKNDAPQFRQLSGTSGK